MSRNPLTITIAVVALALLLPACVPPKSSGGAEARPAEDPGAEVPVEAAMESGADFGETAKLTDADTIPVSRVLDAPQEFDGKYVRVRGEVVGVCAKKGCWIRMAPEGTEDPNLFVKFTCPVGGRLIPMEAEGQEAVVEGTLQVEVVSEDEARHYAEDDGKSPEEIAKIVGEQRRLRLASPAARVMGITAPPVEKPTSRPTSRPTTRPAGS